MFTFALLGFGSSAISTAINVLIVVGVVLWAALIFWTWSDARRRLDDTFLVVCATLASLFPFIGTLVYLLVRPPEYRDEVRLRELELEATKARIHKLSDGSCPSCERPVNETFLACPHCAHELKTLCPECSKPTNLDWAICPHCTKQLQPISAKTRRKRAPRKSSSASR